VRLLDKKGISVSRVMVPELATDASYSLDDAGQWHEDWPPSPGQVNAPPPLGGPMMLEEPGKHHK
jgi:hypothetical protein